MQIFLEGERERAWCMCGSGASFTCIFALMENDFMITSGISSGVGLTSQLSYVLFPLLLAHLMPQAPSALPFSVLTCTVVLLILLPTLSLA